jgi:hypothetical protein
VACGIGIKTSAGGFQLPVPALVAATTVPPCSGLFRKAHLHSRSGKREQSRTETVFVQSVECSAVYDGEQDTATV